MFHLQGIRWERPQFLSKSFLGFLTFNIISYGLLFAEVLTTQIAEPPPNDRSFYTHLFNGCYAVLLFIVVVFFLIYGVEVYFKVGDILKRGVIKYIRSGFKWIALSLWCIRALTNNYLDTFTRF